MKLFSIAKTLNKKQLSMLLIYIELYHKKNSAVYRIAYWLDEIEIWQRIQEQEISSEMLFSEYSIKMKPQTFLNTLTILGNIAEEFLGWVVWKNSTNLKKSCQLTGLAQKSLSDEYLRTQKTILTESDNNVISIWEDYYKMRALFNDYYYQVSPADDNYTQEFNDLIVAFRNSTATIAQILKVEIMNREKLLSESWDQHNDFFNLLYKNDTKLVHITDHLIQMIYHKDINSYNFLRDILGSDKIDDFSVNIQYCIASYCSVFLIGFIKQGGVDRGQELLDLYEFSLEKQIFSLNELIPLDKFINTIGLASKFERYDWANNLVKKWAHKVDKYNSKSIAKLGYATIDFHQKKYEKVVVTLSKATLSKRSSLDFMHKIRSRWILLKAQYEINKNHVQIVKIQVDNFRRILISNESRIKKSTFEAIKASIKIISMILDRKDTDQILDYYASSKYIFERKWILEKIKNPMR